MSLNNIKAIIESRWGIFVKDYIEMADVNYLMGWKWKSLEDLLTNRTKIITLMDILQKRSLVLNEGSDSIMRIGANSRNYNPRGYKTIVEKNNFERTEVTISLC